MFIIILYVLTIILYTDWECSLYQKIYIDKNSHTTYIRGDCCNNGYLIMYYKSKHACLLCMQFFHWCSILWLKSLTNVQFLGSILILISPQFSSVYILACLSNKLSKEKIALCSKLYKNHSLYHQPRPSVLELSKTRTKGI